MESGQGRGSIWVAKLQRRRLSLILANYPITDSQFNLHTRMQELVRHRQTKETEQIGFTYGTPRQSSTLRIRPIVWSLESAPLFLYGRECRAIRLKASPLRLESFRPTPSIA